MHYMRWKRYGDALADKARHSDPEDSFADKVAWDGEHLIWTGGTTRDGYGRLRVNGRKVSAHRYAWQQAHGPIPEGMWIDHICHTPACVLPDHLRLATRQQNRQNLSGANRGRDLPRGVRRTRSGRYGAQVGHNGQRHHLGTFDTPEEAAAVASAKRKELFGEFAGAA